MILTRCGVLRMLLACSEVQDMIFRDFRLKNSKMSRNEQRMKLFEIFKVFLRKITLEKRFKKRISEKE